MEILINNQHKMLYNHSYYTEHKILNSFYNLGYMKIIVRYGIPLLTIQHSILHESGEWKVANNLYTYIRHRGHLHTHTHTNTRSCNRCKTVTWTLLSGHTDQSLWTSKDIAVKLITDWPARNEIPTYVVLYRLQI